MTDDVRKLLGGYATGTLTEEERRVLYAAALEDQTLFEALADEHLLRQLLEDPASRARLLQATETPRFTIGGVLREWFERPRSKALVAVGAVLFVSIGIREFVWKQRTTAPVETIAKIAPAPVREAPPAAVVPREADSLRKAAPAPRPKPAAPGASVERKAEAVLADEASQVIAAAPPPPTVAKRVAAPEPVTRVVRAGEVEMKYTLLLRNAEGEYLPVSADRVFDRQDRLRVRVEVNRDGMVTLTGHDGSRVQVSNVIAGNAVTLPAELDFAQADEPHIELSFAPLPAEPAMGFTAAREEARKTTGARAAVSGASAMTAPAQPLTIRLHLRRKP